MVEIPNIAFNSRTIKDKTVGNGQTYIFTDSVYNYGEGYDNTTGIFTAPGDGMYLFTTSMCVQNNHYNEYAIAAKDKDVAKSFMYGVSGNPCNSLSAVVFLKVSDTVFVRSTYSGTRVREDSNRWSTFTGFLLHRQIFT